MLFEEKSTRPEKKNLLAHERVLNKSVPVQITYSLPFPLLPSKITTGPPLTGVLMYLAY